ncbi:hypothetical protein [Streptomyces sp. HSG2]|uniref:SCO4983 family protein n=1 Tax=Streptomyces sp. HSG2 TaxID=2797167 RepID=UPI00190782D7|nr:hypothetical protein [Streptomyces sp. HSG2]
MYEPIRGKSVHTTTAGSTPRRSREAELDIQLAGHLAALLTVTDELRARTPSHDLDTAARRIAGEVARLRGGRSATRAPLRPGASVDPAVLHRRARDLAGRALVVAASRADTTVAILAAERMDAHGATPASREPVSH